MGISHRLHLGPLALLLPAALAAQLGPIGLTTEGAQLFENPDPPPFSSYFGYSLAVGDFNGDGVDDLATGAPEQATPGTNCDYCGVVVVRHGSRGAGLVGGPPATVLQLPLQTLPLELVYFGASLAAGDFDGDGFDDLAVGIPEIDSDRGAVQVFYGSSAGLQLQGAEVLVEASAGEPHHICDGADFGSALAAGNFDGDAYADLAVGAPGGCDKLGSLPKIPGGSVFVFHGKPQGLLPFLGYRMAQSSFGNDPVESGDRFGAALAIGDFDADAHDDLAIGVPRENDWSGAVQIVMGSQFGLIYAHNAFWLPGALGEVPEQDDRLGTALATGDFDGDGHDDLAIGSPDEDVEVGGGSVADAGSVAVAYGAPDPYWFDLSRTDRLSQSTIHGSEIHEGNSDRFGAAFGVGDFDGDGPDDLAIGHPFDSWAGEFLGAVTVLMGTAPGIGQSTRFHLLAIGQDGVPGDGTEPQAAGSVLATGDFDASGHPDLVIGAPDYDGSEGAEVVLYSDTRFFTDGFETGSASRWSAIIPH